MVEAKRLLDENAAAGDKMLESTLIRRGTSFAMRKVVIVGDSGVGKTAIVSRFING